MTINIPLKGKKALEKIFKHLNITFNWGLQPKEILILTELYYKNISLKREKHITEAKDRATIIFSKSTKDEMIKRLNTSYNSFANTITKFRKLNPMAVSKDNMLNPLLTRIDPFKPELTITIVFNYGDKSSKKK